MLSHYTNLKEMNHPVTYYLNWNVHVVSQLVITQTSRPTLSKLVHEKLCLFLGPTGSGKSVLCKKLLENAMTHISPPPVECLFNYSVYQSLYDTIRCPFPIRFVEGLSNVDDLTKDGQHRIWILDDLMGSVSDSSAICDVYTKYSHHLNYSVVILSQNLYEKGRYFRTISLNTQYLWLLKSVRDTSIISTLGRQMGNTKFLASCYEQAMTEKFGHLFIDMRSSTDDKYRIRSKIFSEPSVVYLK